MPDQTMIREYLKPDKNQIAITIPDEFLNRELEILVFPVTDIKHSIQKTNQLAKMAEAFKKARFIKVDKDIDIDEIMNEMNHALH